MTFTYFDPDQGRYSTLSKGPITLSVREAPAGSKPTVVGAGGAPAAPRPPEKLGTSIVYLKSDVGRVVTQGRKFFEQPWFLILQGVPALALVCSLLVQFQRRKLSGDVRYARSRRAYRSAQTRLAEAQKHLKEGKGPEFYAAIFRALQDYLGDRLNLPSSGITSTIVDEQLHPRGVAKDVCEGFRQLFADCDSARFAPQLQNGLSRERTLKTAKEAIAAMEKSEL